MRFTCAAALLLVIPASAQERTPELNRQVLEQVEAQLDLYFHDRDGPQGWAERWETTLAELVPDRLKADMESLDERRTVVDVSVTFGACTQAALSWHKV